MDLTIMWKNLELSNSVEAYAHKRLAKLDRRLKQVVPAKAITNIRKALKSLQAVAPPLGGPGI